LTSKIISETNTNPSMRLRATANAGEIASKQNCPCLLDPDYSDLNGRQPLVEVSIEIGYP
jgi:hypothetical protein